MNDVWFGVYDVYPEIGAYLKARFDREEDAREYVDMLKERYPKRRYSLMKYTKTGEWTQDSEELEAWV